MCGLAPNSVSNGGPNQLSLLILHNRKIGQQLAPMWTQNLVLNHIFHFQSSMSGEMTPRQDTPRPVLDESIDSDSYPASKEPLRENTEITEPYPISEEEEENLTDYGIGGSEYSVGEEVSPSVSCNKLFGWLRFQNGGNESKCEL